MKTAPHNCSGNPLIIGTKFLRYKNLNLPYQRTKYIANPLLVEVTGVHNTEINLGESSMFIVPSQPAEFAMIAVNSIIISL